MDVVKIVEKSKGYKRHAGALVLVALYALRVFGVDVPDGAEEAIGALGAGLFGAGWLHAAVKPKA